MWCLAHRAELAIKDALKSSTFDQIDDMIYFGYITFMISHQKSAGSWRVSYHIGSSFCKFDYSGVRALQAIGTRWVAHKVNAMKRVLSKCGAYTSHLAALY